MPNPNIHLLWITDINITYLTDILLVHSQRLRSEERVAAVSTSTKSAIIVISPSSNTIFPDETLSDTSEKTYPYEIPSKEPPELPTVTDPGPVECSSGYLSSFLEFFSSDIPTESPTLALAYEPHNYYPS